MIRTLYTGFNALAFILSALVVSALLVACEQYALGPDDPGQASLTSFTVEPDSVDVTAGERTATFVIGIRSPGGADSAVVMLSSPSGAETLPCVSRHPTTGGREAGLWECTVTVAPEQETGVWRTEQVRIHRNGNELLRLTGADLLVANYPVTLRVGREAPTVAILAPEAGSHFAQGEPVTFIGSARSATGDALPNATLVWSSNLDGEIGRGEEVVTETLSGGAHTITLTLVDPYGPAVSASVGIQIGVDSGTGSIVVDPASVGLERPGDTIRLNARAFDPSGREIVDPELRWTSSNADVVTVDEQGLVTAHATGFSRIRVSAGDLSAEVLVSVGGPVVTIFTPNNNQTFAEGTTIDFIGTAFGSDGVQILDSELTWRSNDGVIGIGRHVRSGALSLGTHEVVLSARDRFGRTGETHVRIEIVPAASVDWIEIVPELAVVEMGDTVHLTATAYDSEDNPIPGVAIHWSSAKPSIATVDNQGVVTGVLASQDPIEITASAGGASSSVLVEVYPPYGLPHAEIVTPVDGATVIQGDSVRFVGSTLGVDGKPVTVDEDFRWLDEDDELLGTGRELSVLLDTPGVQTIRLSVRDAHGYSATAQVEITVVEPTPGEPTVTITAPNDGATFTHGTPITFTGSAVGGSGESLSGSALVWTSDRDGVLGTGSVLETEALSDGVHIITLTATDGGGRTGSYDIVIEITATSVIAYITIEPSAAGVMEPGDTARFTARAFDSSDNEIADVDFVWRAPAEIFPVASIDENGLATALTEGRAFIEAAAGDFRATAQLIVGPPTLTITSPERQTEDVDPPVWGETIEFSGWGTSRDGVELTDDQLVWTSSIDGQIGTGRSFITSYLSAGLHEITLTGTDRFGLVGTATIDTLLVTPRDFHEVRIEPAGPVLLEVAGTIQFEARTFTIPGGDEMHGMTYQWLSSDPSIVSIDSNGVATAHADGEAMIIALTNTGMAQLTVYVGTGFINYIEIIPDELELEEVGDTVHLTARAYDRAEQLISGVKFNWRSNDEDVVSVDDHGVVTATGYGVTEITLNAGDRWVFAEVRVGSEPEHLIDYIDVQPWYSELYAIGDTLHLTASAHDRYEREITGVTFTWSTSDPTIATVTQDGVVTAHGFGEVDIEASVGDITGSLPIRVVERITYEKLDIGSGNGCGLADGGAAICWGSNRQGKLGDPGTTAFYSYDPVRVSGGIVFDTIAIGSDHIVGLTPDGRAYAWGGNEYGQLGNGTTIASNVPVPVAGGLRFTSISTFYEHTVALTADGTAYTWGRNDLGQLGDGTTIDRHSPTPVATSLKFEAIDAGWRHTLALTADGQAYGWGDAGNGRLGDGDPGPRPDPVTAPIAVAHGHSFAAVSAGNYHSLGLTADGRVYGWGFNVYGQVGDGTIVERHTPQPVAGTGRFTSISAGQDFSLALDVSGNAWSWGNNDLGKLGDGTLEHRNVPTLVVGGHHFTSVMAGTTSAGGLTAGGIPYAWGSNASGQLGVWTSSQSSVPVPSTLLTKP